MREVLRKIHSHLMQVEVKGDSVYHLHVALLETSNLLSAIQDGPSVEETQKQGGNNNGQAD